MIAVSKVCCRSFGTFSRHLARLGLQLAIVVAGTLVPPSLRPLVATRIAQSIGLRFQHRVQRLLDCSPHDPAQVLTHPLVVDPDHIAQLRPSAILFHGGSLLNWLRRSSRNANLTRAGATAQCANDSLRHRPAWRRADRIAAAARHGGEPSD